MYMINEKLLSYIKSQLDAGVSRDQITASLEEAGWRTEDIKEGFEAVDNGLEEGSPESHQQIRQEAQSSDQTTDGQKNTDAQTDDEVTRSGQSAESSQSGQSGLSNQGSNSQKSTSQEASPKSGSTSDAEDRQGTDQVSTSDSDETETTQTNDLYREDPQTASDTGAGNLTGSAASDDPVTMRTMESDKAKLNSKSGGSMESSKSTGKRDSGDSVNAQKETAQTTEEKSGGGPGITTGSDLDSNETAGSSRGEAGDNSSNSNTKRVQTQQAKKSRAGGARTKPQGGPTGRSGGPGENSRIQQARQKESSSNFLAIIASVVVLILIGGGGAYAYFTYFAGDSLSSQSVMSALANTQTFQYRIGIGPQQAASDADTFVLEGAVDIDPSTPQESYYTIRGSSTTADPPVTALTADLNRFSELDDRRKQTVQDALFNSNFFSVGSFQTEQQLGSESQNQSFMTRRFAVEAQPDQLTQAYAQIYKAIFDTNLDPGLRSELSNRLGTFTPNQGRMWIDTDTNVPYQVTFVGKTQSGESKKVNFQFKNHGEPIEPAPDTYKSQPLATGLASFLNVSASQEAQDTGPTTSSPPADEPQEPEPEPEPDPEPTSTPPETEERAEPEPTDSPNQNQNRSQNEAAHRADELRINHIQQIRIALQLYAKKNTQFPDQLTELTTANISDFGRLPRDPRSGALYEYAVSNQGDRFHVGATLEVKSPTELDMDMNFNSQGFPAGGFNGAAANCGGGSSDAATCYDISETMN
jgi:hypothetical protein